MKLRGLKQRENVEGDLDDHRGDIIIIISKSDEFTLMKIAQNAAVKLIKCSQK
jgi:hypothetical protein